MFKFKIAFLLAAVPLTLACYQAQASIDTYSYNSSNQMVSINNNHLLQYAPSGSLSQADTLRFVRGSEIQGNIVATRFGGVILRSDGTSESTFTDRHNTPKTSSKRVYSEPYGKHDLIELDIHNNIQVFGGAYSLFGLEYMHARWYFPELKRFGAQDSFDVTNRYNIDDGNPIMNYDPSGHISQNDWINGAGAIGGLAALIASAGAFAAVAGAAGMMSAVFGVIGEHSGNTKYEKASLYLGIGSLGMDLMSAGGTLAANALSARKVTNMDADIAYIKKHYDKFANDATGQELPKLETWKDIGGVHQFMEDDELLINNENNFISPAEFLDSKLGDWKTDRIEGGSITTRGDTAYLINNNTGAKVAFSNRISNSREFRGGLVESKLKKHPAASWRDVLNHHRMDLQKRSGFILNPLMDKNGAFVAEGFKDKENLNRFLDSKTYGKKLTKYMGYKDDKIYYTPREIFQAQRKFWEYYGVDDLGWVKTIDKILV